MKRGFVEGDFNLKKEGVAQCFVKRERERREKFSDNNFFRNNSKNEILK